MTTLARGTGGELEDPRLGALLNDRANLPLIKGSEIVFVPTERMPTETGLAASYRF